MLKKLLVLGMAFSFVLAGVPGICATLETDRLIIKDITGNMSPENLEALARKVDSTLTKVLKFWATEPRTKEFGKITVEFGSPLSKGTASSLFFWGKEKGQRIRIVRVFGGDQYPHLLAHKLTSAVFPNSDKLIRNMMGEASEKRFGNPKSFPACGFENDEWVMALIQIGSGVPLNKIGTDHQD